MSDSAGSTPVNPLRDIAEDFLVEAERIRVMGILTTPQLDRLRREILNGVDRVHKRKLRDERIVNARIRKE